MNLISPKDAREFRRKRNFTQPQVADMIGVARNTYTLWEGEKRALPKGAHVALTAWCNGEISQTAYSGAEKLFARGLKEVLAIVDGDLPPATKRELLRNGMKNLGILFDAWDAPGENEGGAAEGGRIND